MLSPQDTAYPLLASIDLFHKSRGRLEVKVVVVEGRNEVEA